MRLAIFLCLPIVVYITLLITSESLKPASNLHTNTTAADLPVNMYTFAPKIHPHVAPLAGFVTTLLVTLVMALQTHETPEIFFGMLIEADIFINLFAFPPGTSMPQLTWVLILVEAIGYILLDCFLHILLLGAGLNSTQMGFLGKSPFYVATVSWVVGNGLSSIFTGVGTFIHKLCSALLCKTIPQSPSLPAPCTTTTPGPIIGDSPFKLNPSQSLASMSICLPPPYSIRYPDNSNDIELGVEKYDEFFHV